MDRTEHCDLKKLDKNGKCIASCSKNVLIDGTYVDCAGVLSETIEEYRERIDEAAKHH